MRRVSVVGNSGSGKSTLARRLAERLQVPYVELDAIYHQPDWVELERDEFRARVAEVIAGDRWVVDGNYSAVRDLVWAAADSVVWVDPPRRTVMRRVVARTVVRTVTRQELWHGNREPWTNLTSLDPQRSIVAWAWTRHAVYRDRYERAQEDPTWSELEIIRVRRQREARLLLAAASPSG